MAREITNDCCSCAVDAYPCIGKGCPLRRVEHFYCDVCGSEETLYEYDGKELCAYCLTDFVPKVEGSDI